MRDKIEKGGDWGKPLTWCPCKGAAACRSAPISGFRVATEIHVAIFSNSIKEARNPDLTYESSQFLNIGSNF